jgi:hypothetical protein
MMALGSSKLFVRLQNGVAVFHATVTSLFGGIEHVSCRVWIKGGVCAEGSGVCSFINLNLQFETRQSAVSITEIMNLTREK